MKICIWSSGSFEEWYSSYHLMLKIILEMLSAGHEVWLIQEQRNDGRMPDELQNQEKLHVINIKKAAVKKQNFVRRYLGSIQYYISSFKAFKTIERIDAVFLQSNNTAIIPIRYIRKLKIPVLYNVQDIFPLDALFVGKISSWNPLFWIVRALQAQAYKKATRVVTISEDLAKTIRAEGRRDVDVIYNWSYQNEPYRIPDESNHFLLSNKIRREDCFRVIYAGNVGQMIDGEMIVGAAKALSDKKDIVFFIIGEGSGLKRLKNRVSEEGLNNVLFFPRQPMEYAQDNYCAADININPMPKGIIYTCMPSKTATCLLSEKPTVVSMDSDSDMAARLKTVDQWTVVAPGDAQGMADAIRKVYENGAGKSENAASFLKEMGPIENARKYVEILEEIALH